MKTITPFLLFALAANYCFAQSPIPVLQQSANWYMVKDEIVYVDTGQGYYYYFDTTAYIYWIGGDTSLYNPVNQTNEIYRKLFRADQPEEIYDEINSEYEAGVQETNGQLWVHDGGYPWISYDPNLVVGDTAFQDWCCMDFTYLYMVVENIDTVILDDGIPRKQWDFRLVMENFPEPVFYDTVYWENHWIEGIGSLCPFEKIPCFLANVQFDVRKFFNCYSNNDMFLLEGLFGGAGCLEFITHTVDDIQESELSVILAPNPTTGIIEYHTTSAVRLSTTVYNLQGRKVKTNLNGEIISISDLPEGIYLLEIVDEISGRRKVEKIVLKKN